MKFFEDKVVLVTGGGSLGGELVRLLLNTEINAVRVLDVSEHSLFQLQQKFNSKKIRYLLGDITDYDRVEFAARGVDYVIHTAANKFVDYIEYNPIQAINTNINGTINVVKAVLKTPAVKKMMYISTDKACMPVSTYGMTKAISEKLVIWGNQISGKVFSCIRFPNFMPSKGSVFEIWEEQMSKGQPLTVTDKKMKRYFIPLEQAAHQVLQALTLAEGSEIFVPASVKERRIIDLAKEKGVKIKITGKRAGEKLSEMMMTMDERERAVKLNDLWVIRN